MSSTKSHECKDCETILESNEELDKHIAEEHSEDGLICKDYVIVY